MKNAKIRQLLSLVLCFLLVTQCVLLPATALTDADDLTGSASSTVALNAYEGTFFVKNRGLRNYLQVDDGDSPNYSSIGSIMELWDFDGEEYQKWKFIHVGEGYYRISPNTVPDSAYVCIAVAEGKETSSQSALVLDTYHYSDGYLRKQWTISATGQGTYIIRPRCGELNTGDWIMCAGNGIGSNGRNVEHRTRNASLNYKDEWFFLSATDTAFSAGGGIMSGTDVIEAADYWRRCGYNSIYDINATAASLTASHLNSSIVYFSTHGLQHEIELPNGDLLTDGVLYSGVTCVPITNFSLTNAKLYVYNACLTASNEDGSGQNLCTKTLERGAECVIGWPVSIPANDLDWMRRFESKLLEGSNVEAAVNYANSFTYLDNRIKTAIIHGNKNLVINIDAAHEILSTVATESNNSSVYKDALVISYKKHDVSLLRTILKNNFETYNENSEYTITITQTNGSPDEYVIDYVYLHNGYQTNSGYCAIVKNGYIICMRDNTIQNTSNEASAVQQTVCVPTLTQNDIDNAYKQAALELQATNCTYSVINQSSKKIYNMETNKYYCCVTTVYNTASKAYGCFTSLYEIYCS